MIPVNIHKLSNRFRPKLATMRVLSLGTKFIPKWNQCSRKRTFVDFNDFRRKLNTRAFFVEEKPGLFVQCKEFRVKNYFVPPEEDKDIHSFCWELRDEIDNFEKSLILDKPFK